MSDTQSVDLVSTSNGRDYRLLVWVPPVAPPAAGFPVLWVLDGFGYFGLSVDMVRCRALVGLEISATVVVGVSYPDTDLATCLSRRYLDFTASPPGSETFAGGQPTGGIEGFLDMLADEALPAVARTAPIDRGRMALIGHSLGGHAVLHALLTRPASFQSFLAVSPSIWWNGEELLARERGFADRLARTGAAPRVFVAVGAREDEPLVPLAGFEDVDLTRANAMIAGARMVERAAAFHARVAATTRLDARYACIPEETHASVPFAAWRPALDTAFALESSR